MQCKPCKFSCEKRGDWNRHIKTNKHLRIHADLERIIHDQKEQIRIQQEKLSQITTPIHITIILEQYKDAMNWEEFISTLELMTPNIIPIMIEKIKELGLYRRPIHCLDIKRKKNCVKDKNEWKKEATDVVRKGIGEVSNKFKFVLHDWAKKNPEWHENQGLAEQFIDMMNIYMREPDEDKCMQYLYKKVSLDDKKKN